MLELDTESVLAELCIAFAEELTAATVFLEFAEAAAAILLKTDGDGEPIVPVGRTGNGPTMDDETVAVEIGACAKRAAISCWRAMRRSCIKMPLTLFDIRS